LNELLKLSKLVNIEEQAAGYQVAHSRLSASDVPEPDPVGYVTDMCTKSSSKWVGPQLIAQMHNE
jgi:hypothetical protein